MKKIIVTLLLTVISGWDALAQTNEPPVAVSMRDTVVMALLPMDFLLDATGSVDPDGNLIDFYWVVNGDTVGNAIRLSTQIASKETKIELIVTDDAGASDTESYTLFTGHPTNVGLNRIPLRNGEVPLFASGMNIAWNRFANDLSKYDDQAKRYFNEIMDSVSANGGNALRWWLHTNGANTPQVDANGYVTGMDFTSIQNMKHILDLAFDHGIGISMCLWSFDMLQNNQGQNVAAMKLLLENPDNVQSYVDNALIPILTLLGNHPAVLTWEIFNEPEGMTNQFGWSSGGRVTMFEVQRFVNKCAGAIHREVPDALVSNGSWSFRASTDVGSNTNYYSDEALIAAGGDIDGVLDFYQVHYYPQHFGNDRSPFHRPADHWGLDKPIVIGEFPADTIGGKANPGYAVSEAYVLAEKYGYAGVMSWSWTDYNVDFSGTTGSGLRKIRDQIPNDIVIPNEAIVLNRIPEVLTKIKPYRSLLETISDVPDHQQLSEVFTDDQSAEELIFSVTSVTEPAPVIATITNGVLGYSFVDPVSGTSKVTIKAQEPEGWYVETEAIVMLGSIEGHENNLAYYQPVMASSSLEPRFDVYLNDGNKATSWASQNDGMQWVVLDFGENRDYNFMALDWTGDYATNYEIQRSDDGETWTTIYSEENGMGGEKVIVFGQIEKARYHRVLMLESSNGKGYGIDEWRVEYVPNNTPPSIIQVVDNYEVDLSAVKSINNYVRFQNVFTDLEHPEFLEYKINNSNEELLKASKSLGDVGVSLLFNPNSVGTTIITLFATDPFGAEVSTSFEVTVSDNVLKVVSKTLGIIIYPNPTRGPILIAPPDEEAGILGYDLYDLEGSLILSNSFTNSTFEVDLTGLPKGVYILDLQSSEGSKLFKIQKID